MWCIVVYCIVFTDGDQCIHVSRWGKNTIETGHQNKYFFVSRTCEKKQSHLCLSKEVSVGHREGHISHIKHRKNLVICVAHRHPGPISPNHLAKFKQPRVYRLSSIIKGEFPNGNNCIYQSKTDHWLWPTLLVESLLILSMTKFFVLFNMGSFVK